MPLSHMCKKIMLLISVSNTDRPVISKYPNRFTVVTVIYTFILLILLMELHHSKSATKIVYLRISSIL